ncbi:MAG: serine hydrolase domain-containing protein [Methylomagnum sp.]
MRTHPRISPRLLGLAFCLMLTAGLYYAWAVLTMGVAYKAKLLCSGVFVAHRPAEDVLSADLAVDDLAPLRHFDAAIDPASRTATASVAGLFRRTALFRPGLGCTLLALDWPDPPAPPAQFALPPDSSARIVADAAPFPPLPSENKVRLGAALERAFAEPDAALPRRTRAVVVVHEGRIVAERYAPGFDATTPLAGWSLAKTAMNALTGVLVGEGRLSLSTPVLAPEWAASDDARRAITLNHLLRMESGLRFTEEPGNPLQDVTAMLLREPDAAGFAARKHLQASPGTRWHYASGPTNLLSRLIRHTLGEADYPGFPKRALFGPLGMDSAVIEQDASGTFVGSSFMYATARDWAKLGRLFLQDGVWEGRRILPEGWVAYTATPSPSDPERGYGAHVRLKLDGGGDYPLPGDAFHGVGFEGQYLTVIPSRQLVVVRLGLTRRPEAWRQGDFVGEVLAALEVDWRGSGMAASP